MYKVVTIKCNSDSELERKLDYVSEKGYSVVSVLDITDCSLCKYYKLLLSKS